MATKITKEGYLQEKKKGIYSVTREKHRHVSFLTTLRGKTAAAFAQASVNLSDEMKYGFRQSIF